MAVSLHLVSSRLVGLLKAAIPLLAEVVDIPVRQTAKAAAAASLKSMTVTKAEVLLAVGRAAVPTEATSELNVLYGLVRYATMVAAGGGTFRFNTEARDIDSHKKAVLSDELGCGMALLYATTAFSVSRVLDFESAMRIGFVKPPPGKRRKNGALKRPDYALELSDRRIVLLESKGTTQSTSASLRQLKEACKQVKTPTLTGQWGGKRVVRIATGLELNFRSKRGAIVNADDPDGEGDDDYFLNIEPQAAVVRAHHYRLAVATGDVALADFMSLVRDRQRDYASEENTILHDGAIGSEIVLASPVGRVSIFFGLDEEVRSRLLAQSGDEFEEPTPRERVTEYRDGVLSVRASDGAVLQLRASRQVAVAPGFRSSES